MFTKERHEKILELLKIKNSVTVTELEKMFDVSSETIRRDLLSLESNKQLIRVHGGAMSIVKTVTDKGFEERHTENRKEKSQIAECAASFINEGDTISINSGSTAVFLCEEIIKRFEKLTVITSSLMVFDILTKKPGFNVILSGGYYDRDSECFYGDLTVDTVRKMHVSKAFIAPSGISLKFGITEFNHNYIDVQRAYAEIADKVFIIADSSKFETGATYRTFYLTEDHTIISDKNLSDEIYDKYSEANIDIVR